ncbi:indole-3-glycerol phosphate synthase [Pseudarcicella hirudinis]|uniref:indole-3-glycerol-phosphate synthase n=1 Tax=Pseudarcicella hirudinis TaxID=1079859 RepID=A0A1I5Q7G2_9BACT|nr:indole-3-glycerol phosphate synthase TrpC [Pseudarcicella hirudinis]SFP41980.1 indole-3-glycerol phosphate synthase [Pseudarcicella hirudinis]
MTILDKIIANKTKEVETRKMQVPISLLEKSSFFAKATNSLKTSLLNPASTGIISEFKRKSPSKGIINANVTVEEVTAGYVKAGASCLSVLTDSDFFGGSDEDFLKARRTNPGIPMLRKDFMIDEYQIIEAKSLGADVILLIAANLTPQRIQELGRLVKELGMETLLEVHDEEELNRSLCSYIDVVGVNNRNLKNFAEQNVNASLELADKIPSGIIKISESCISQPETIKLLKSVGYKGFLIGETFMKTADPGQALKEFIQDL